MHLSAGRFLPEPAAETESCSSPRTKSALHRIAAVQVFRLSGSRVPKGVTGKEWKLPVAGWSRKARAVVRDLESSFSPEWQVSRQVRPLAAPNWTAAPGQLRKVACPFKQSFERPLRPETCHPTYGNNSGKAAPETSALIGWHVFFLVTCYSAVKHVDRQPLNPDYANKRSESDIHGPGQVVAKRSHGLGVSASTFSIRTACAWPASGLAGMCCPSAW